MTGSCTDWETMKDEMVSHEVPTSLDEVVVLGMHIDQRVHPRQRERGIDPHLRSPSCPLYKSTSDSWNLQSQNSNLCLYCRGPGHSVVQLTANPWRTKPCHHLTPTGPVRVPGLQQVHSKGTDTPSMVLRGGPRRTTFRNSKRASTTVA